jgi:hypothetical protein
MANPVGTFATYQAIGIREDLTDMIYRISPRRLRFLIRLPARRRRARSTNGKSTHSDGRGVQPGG